MKRGTSGNIEQSGKGWRREDVRASVGDVHQLDIAENPERSVFVYAPERSALVLGSTQPLADVDLDVARALDIDVVRRRSGGGAVLIEPDHTVWLDVLIPRGDALWSDDVGRSFHWLGRVLANALGTVGYDRAQVYEGPLVTTRWSPKVCFAGLGPGELTVGGKKIVGISQRRTRQGALFQVCTLRKFNAEPYARLLGINVDEISPSVGALAELDGEAFVAALFSQLPPPGRSNS